MSPSLPPPPPPTPEAAVLKSYERYKTMLDDSDAEFYLTRWINALATAYDPHTGYMSPVSKEDFDIHMSIKLTGIGATLESEDGAAKVKELIPGGPAARDTRDIRLRKNDKIIAVGQGDEELVDILHWPIYRSVRLIRGDIGTKVVLLVESADDPSGATTKIVDLIRDEVKLEDQAATSQTETLTDAEGRTRTLGVVTLPTFYAGDGRSCSADIARLLAKLNEQNVEGLILDLRSNGGGALNEAVSLAGLFFKTGPVVQTVDRGRHLILNDYDPSIAFRKPVIVMIDRFSASASEIVAAALKDHGRAILVGDSHSHGKGTVQQVIPLSHFGNMGSIKVTNASFYRINGSSTQVKGVDADIVLPSLLDTYTDIGEDQLPCAIPWSQIPATQFVAITNLAPMIATLREKSDERLAHDERWQKHLKHLQLAKETHDTKEIPLNIDKRREHAATLKELKLTDADFDDDPDLDADARADEKAAAKRAKDVVLDETLRILVDYIDLHGPSDACGPDAPSPRDLFQRIFQ
ncbi:MAG: carboxy terminal-processing peptidase [Kiritimatiellaeota bacterium]|nr:carboxy terminal-processing peptidase [Kiritimatiellota bacterium]